ncbi:MAG TPA: peptide ABC transporter substrate-binding protein [Gemmatimonadaceae bacterium]|nr:peptide ABC transporter substrate-binding protein [Gemmatimonadaceae bacterium]
MSGRWVASIATCVLGLSCGPSPRPADVVVFASGSDLESANPLVTIHPLSRQVQRHVLFVTLVRYDSTLAFQPYFARSWRWDAQRRSVTMRLAPDLTWHDGAPTTAHDVVFTLMQARNPRVGFARSADLAVLDTAIAESNGVVTLRFGSAQRDLPPLLAELPIVPRHRLAGTAPGEMRRAEFGVAPVGNGPFRFVSRVPGQHWTFQRNDKFPTALGGPPHIRQLVIAVVDEATTKFAGLSAGDLDFAGIAPTMAHLAQRDPAIEVLSYPVLFSNALVFNTQRKPFNDVRVRRAIDATVNRQRIIDAALAGYATPASGPAPPENPFALVGTTTPNPELADSLLDAAGYRRGADGRRPLELELLTVGSGDNAVEQLLQADFAERGIRLDIRQLELAAFLARARSTEKQFDLLITGIPGDLSFAFLGAMFESSQTGSSLDYAGFHSRTLDTLFTKARNASNPAELTAAWHEVQRELAAAMPVVWLYHSRGVQGVATRMHNVVMDLRGELTSVTRWTTGAPGAMATR